MAPDGDPALEGSAVQAIVAELSARGAAVTRVGPVKQPFFSAPGMIYRLDGEDVQFFEYASEEEAASEAALVSADGSSIGTTIVTWLEPPHFYRSGRVIVIYVGERSETLTLLASLLGSPFAEG